MSEATIKSDFNSFEENIFYVSQSQRCLYLIGRYEIDCNEAWFSEYLEDIYFDSFNREFKSFYIEDEDEYGVFTDVSRNELLITLVDKTIQKVYRLTEANLETYLSQAVEFDHENPEVYKSDEFIKEKRLEAELKEPAKRVLFVLINFRRLLRKEKPFTYEELEKNLVHEVVDI